MTKTQEKTMEWKDKFEKRFGKYVYGKNPSGAIKIMGEMEDFIFNLLASSQDSFRRKVEEAVIQDDENELVGNPTRAKIRNAHRAELRAKLKNIK